MDGARIQICEIVKKGIPLSLRSIVTADKTKAKYLISFRFKAKNDWKETMLTGIGSTGNDTSGVERDFVKVLDHMIYHAVH